MTRADETMKVGALARRTGLTVRTLHHYDEIGLLSPSSRTRAGHRLYSADDVARLQRVTSLKHLGLSLEEIGRCLARPEYTLERTLAMQAERIGEQIDRQQRLRTLVLTLRDRLASGDAVTLDELTRTIELSTAYEKYYGPEQLQALERRRTEVGDDRIRAAEREWAELFEAYRVAMDEGLDPADETVQALARRSAALIEEFTGGDEGLRSSLRTMYATEGADRMLETAGMEMPAGLWAYMARARGALEDAR